MDISNPTSFREKVCDRLNVILEDKTLATNMEKGIYNYAIKEAGSRKIIKKWENPYFSILYIDRLRSIYFNIKNEELLQLIKTKEITPQTVAFMTHQELNPEHWKELIDKKIKRDANKFTMNIQASTDMFTCKKCRSKKCTYYELQTRSADEPATIFVTCLDCGKNWKT
uniref:TFIIS-type domain-containing protein n=1 Tax=viral metagenome TaxID=1070528 RepID=A0A6C0DPV3_9ZZZZ